MICYWRDYRLEIPGSDLRMVYGTVEQTFNGEDQAMFAITRGAS